MIEYVVTEVVSGFEDTSGNRISGATGKATVKFTGKKANLVIGDTKLNNGVRIKLGNKASIKIGSNVKFSGDVSLAVGNNGKLEIGDNSSVTATNIAIYHNASMIVGRNAQFNRDSVISIEHDSHVKMGHTCTFRVGLFMVAHRNTRIEFGDDCMSAAKVHIRSSDGHAIYDLTKKEKHQTPQGKDIAIKFGNHVWLGYDCMILYNTNIGSGSVVGAKSLVKGTFGENSLIVGNPAKCIRENIAWDRDASKSYEDFTSRK